MTFEEILLLIIIILLSFVLVFGTYTLLSIIKVGKTNKTELKKLDLASLKENEALSKNINEANKGSDSTKHVLHDDMRVKDVFKTK